MLKKTNKLGSLKCFKQQEESEHWFKCTKGNLRSFMKRWKAVITYDGHLNTSAIIRHCFNTKNTLNDRRDKNTGRGDKGGVILPQVTTALAIYSYEKERKSPLAGINQRYIWWTPPKTHKHKNLISKLRCVCMYVCVCIHIYITCLREEKRYAKHRRPVLLKVILLLKRESEKNDKKEWSRGQELNDNFFPPAYMLTSVSMGILAFLLFCPSC